MTNTKLRYGTDVADRLIAVENAMSSITEAMEELKGIGEFSALFDALATDLSEMEREKDELESYMSGEYQAQRAEMARDYYRSVI